MATMSRMLIADDHRIFVEEFKEVVTGIAKFTVADVAIDRDELLAKIVCNEYDLLLLDVSLPGGVTINLITQIKVMKPQLPVLILSLYPEVQYAMYALHSGASGYLNKGCSIGELMEALQSVATAKRYFNMLKPAASCAGSGTRTPLHERLTPREYQVMRMIVAGLDSRRIAQELMVGVKMVDSYRLLILQKMEMKSFDELTRYAALHQLMLQRP